MSTKEKNQEVEIAILSKEQIESLPKGVVKPVNSLNGTLKDKQLQTFVPVVEKYIALREEALKLKLEKNDDDEITKESIQAYKDLRKNIGSFNTFNKDEIKKIKKPIDDILKDVRQVEKTFKSESDKIKEAAIKEFQEYEDEKERKKKEAEERKNAAMRKQIEESNKEAEELREKQKRSDIINDIKYNKILEGIGQRANTAVTSLNETSITSLKQELSVMTFDSITAEHDMSIIDEETQKGLESMFNNSIKNAEMLLTDKLNAIKNERELMASRQAPPARNEDISPADPDVPTGTVPQPEGPVHDIPEAPKPPKLSEEWRAELSDEDFIKAMKEQLASITSEVENRIVGGSTNAEIVQLYSNLKSIKL